MHILRISTPLSQAHLQQALQTTNAIALDPDKVQSLEELELADALARKSTIQKNNFSKQFRFEFLLWLAGTRDIRKALEGWGAKDASDVLLVIWEDPGALLKKLQAKPKPHFIPPQAKWESLERISLSRVI